MSFLRSDLLSCKFSRRLVRVRTDHLFGHLFAGTLATASTAILALAFLKPTWAGGLSPDPGQKDPVTAISLLPTLDPFSFLAGGLMCLLAATAWIGTMRKHRESTTIDPPGTAPPAQPKLNPNTAEPLARIARHYRSMIDNAPVGIYRSTPEGKLLEANQTLADIYGYDDTDQLLETITDIPSQIYDSPRQWRNLRRVLAENDQVMNYESRNRRRDGSSIWTSRCVTAVRDEDGQVHHHIGFVTDITEWKNAQESLAASERKLEILLKWNNDVIFMLDDDGRIVFISHAISRYGYSPDTLVGTSIFNLVHSQDVPKMICRFDDRCKGINSTTGTEMRLVPRLKSTPSSMADPDFRENAPVLFVESEGVFEEDSHGRRFIGLLGVGRDITAHRAMETALETSADYYRGLFENTGTATVMMDSESMVTECNDRFSTLVEQKRKDIQGRMYLRDTAAPGERARLAVFLSRIFDGSHNGHKELVYRLSGKDGTERHVVLSAEAMPGKKLFVASLADISRQRMIQDELRRTLRDREILLREVHHRVNNNLQIISSLLELSSRRLDHGPSKTIFNNVHSRIRCMALIHSQLFSQEDLDHVNVGDFVRSLFRTNADLYNRPGPNPLFKLGQVVLHLDKAVPLGLLFNEALNNVFMHAYPDGPGTVELTVSRNPDGLIRAGVSDHGPGIRPEGLAKSDTMGLKLMHTLAGQLGGKLEIACDGGTDISVVFDGSDPKRRIPDEARPDATGTRETSARDEDGEESAAP